MTRRFFSSPVVLAMLLGIPAIGWADPPAGYSFSTYDTGLRQARDSGRPMFIYFGREGCGYCEVTNKTAFSKPDVKKAYESNYELVYVDSESGRRLTLPTGERIAERELGTRFKAFVTPVFLFISGEGKALLKRVGVQSAADLLKYDRYVNGKHYMQLSFEEFEKLSSALN